MSVLTRRQFGGGLLAAGLASQVPSSFAQSGWPSKTIRVVYPYQGGVGDTIFRLFDEQLRDRLKTPMFIDNKAGAAGNIGTAEAVRAAPDGYTFLMAPTGNYSVNQYLFKLNYDPLTQLAPVVAIADAPLIAVVAPSVTARNLKELSDQVKANASRFNFGSPGAGSPTHLAGASFSMAHGNVIEHISFRGTAPMTQAMMSNDVQMAFPTLQSVAGQLQAGRLRAIAVLSKERMKELPNVPTAIESGYPDLVFGNWWVLSAPKGTDTAIIQRMSTEIQTLLTDPTIRTRLSEMGNVALGYGPEQTAAFMRAEAVKYKNLIDKTGIKIDPSNS